MAAVPKSPYSLALPLLLIEATRHYAWALFPLAERGIASKALGAMAALAFLGIIWLLAQKSKALALVMLWAAWEETQTALCSVAYWIQPWPVAVGRSICSEQIGFDLGAIGILIVAVLAYRIAPEALKHER